MDIRHDIIRQHVHDNIPQVLLLLQPAHHKISINRPLLSQKRIFAEFAAASCKFDARNRGQFSEFPANSLQRRVRRICSQLLRICCSNSQRICCQNLQNSQPIAANSLREVAEFAAHFAANSLLREFIICCSESSKFPANSRFYFYFYFC